MSYEPPSVDGDTIYASLWYPRNDGDGVIRKIDIGLYDVRAAQSFIVTYDFERDGFVITREVMIEHETWMEETGETVEVAFIPAWTTKAVIADDDRKTLIAVLGETRTEAERRYANRGEVPLTAGAIRHARREAFERGAEWERNRPISDEAVLEAAKAWSGAPFPSKASLTKARAALEAARGTEQ